ncbi:IS3 family insertion sequence transposase domain-containing protein (plasmid) [Rhizobium phaseoli]|nr:IS3 family insertion sequence transposase domain-containing protein [Rhizobium sp. N731]ANL18494.1 IS3 family insertion sequence transposase domain-containing protein [Rhizobium sp. N1314]ANL68566.1 IS3 family insertion sequence transposase domain-containing protein [Rhizobium phaseoli]ANL75038.1 IS3 family insertion sequence transposase domain-containing protein [Rhizobium phaseoli]ANL81375.1 IS3 family insertion sequence transposase domain-containing protein [Rhizobium phaseoli]
MQNANVESFNGRMRDEMVNQSLFLGCDYARSAIAGPTITTTSGRTHRSDQTRASDADTIAATGSNAARDESFAFPPLGVLGARRL